tara:strand:+ start:104 stop:448 length:345 start_codon:yes stop_codon:yes gene_type:complete
VFTISKVSNDQIGGWAFIVGLVIAVLFGIIQLPSFFTPVLVVLGLVVGLLNVGDKQVTGFLVAAIALLVAGNAGLGVIPAVGGILEGILVKLVAFVAPAAVVVAIKQVYELGRI